MSCGAVKKEKCERSEQKKKFVSAANAKKFLKEVFYGVRLGFGVHAEPWASTYGVLAVGKTFFKKFSSNGSFSDSEGKRGQTAVDCSAIARKHLKRELGGKLLQKVFPPKAYERLKSAFTTPAAKRNI